MDLKVFGNVMVEGYQEAVYRPTDGQVSGTTAVPKEKLGATVPTPGGPRSQAVFLLALKLITKNLFKKVTLFKIAILSLPEQSTFFRHKITAKDYMYL